MFDLADLYKEIILEHSKKPRNFRKPEDANRDAEGHNPLCGDMIHVYARVRDGKVEDVAFQGRGCAISTASASVMTEMVKGHTVEEARAMFERFRHLLTDEEADVAEGLDDLDEMAAFAGVRAYPMRVKCATLCWHTLAAALEDATDVVSTE